MTFACASVQDTRASARSGLEAPTGLETLGRVLEVLFGRVARPPRDAESLACPARAQGGRFSPSSPLPPGAGRFLRGAPLHTGTFIWDCGRGKERVSFLILLKKGMEPRKQAKEFT